MKKLDKSDYQLNPKIVKKCRKFRGLLFYDKDEYEALRLEFKSEKDKISETILSQIRENMPELRFKACPWCNEEPRLAVSLQFD